MNPLLATRIIFFLGLTNIISGLLIFSSCQCLGGSTIGGRLMKFGFYKHYYRFHCYIWWVFWISVMVHAIFAIVYLGLPF